jgi:signal transduction histidine kinase
VQAGVDGEHAVVSILDCGGGIPEEDLPRIFDTGFRGDPARTPGGGAGLGLAIALEVVKAHRGDISVHNQDRGAEFVVRVPAAQPTTGLDAAKDLAAAPPPDTPGGADTTGAEAAHARPVADATP